MLNPLKIFAFPQIEVEWDDVVKNNLKPIYRTQNNARVPDGDCLGKDRLSTIQEYSQSSKRMAEQGAEDVG